MNVDDSSEIEIQANLEDEASGEPKEMVTEKLRRRTKLNVNGWRSCGKAAGRVWNRTKLFLRLFKDASTSELRKMPQSIANRFVLLKEKDKQIKALEDEIKVLKRKLAEFALRSPSKRKAADELEAKQRAKRLKTCERHLGPSYRIQRVEDVNHEDDFASLYCRHSTNLTVFQYNEVRRLQLQKLQLVPYRRVEDLEQRLIANAGGISQVTWSMIQKDFVEHELKGILELAVMQPAELLAALNNFYQLFNEVSNMFNMNIFQFIERDAIADSRNTATDLVVQRDQVNSSNTGPGYLVVQTKPGVQNNAIGEPVQGSNPKLVENLRRLFDATRGPSNPDQNSPNPDQGSGHQ
ncbi:unnamed protein product [Bursaphelenchus okinawaensis]|uniref:Uncharacterized protein n=1 Tax=Bursaphelenchus okinawaensis TaxID=465554 RepID=A0A811K9Y3_9BILA|nr:unnamed protein product [Bursaphelenchus okinawaensis]CAG9098053.1 unnamed protein product [Bursaphelenchus okinawaensis]